MPDIEKKIVIPVTAETADLDKKVDEGIKKNKNKKVELGVDVDLQGLVNAVKEMNGLTETLRKAFAKVGKDDFQFGNIIKSIENVEGKFVELTSTIESFDSMINHTEKNGDFLKVTVGNLGKINQAADALYESLIKIEKAEDGTASKTNKFDNLLETLKDIKGATEQIVSGFDLGKVAPLSKITENIETTKNELSETIQVTDKAQQRFEKLEAVLAKGATAKKAMDVINEQSSDDVIISQKALDSLNEYIRLGGDLSKLPLANGKTMLDFANVLKNEGVLDATAEKILNLTEDLSKLDIERQKAEKRQNGIEINFNQETLDKFAESMSKMSEQMAVTVADGAVLGMKPEDLQKIVDGINEITEAVKTVAQVLESGIDINKINTAVETVKSNAEKAAEATKKISDGTDAIDKKANAMEHLAEAEKKVADNSPTGKVESPISSEQDTNKTAVSSPENVENLQRENVLLEENTAQQKANADARQENQAQQKIGGNDSIAHAVEEEGQTVDKVVTDEVTALQRLQTALIETAQVVDRKTDAFRTEQQTVDGVVQEEITRLEVLSGTILSLASDLEKFTDIPVNIKVEDSGLSEENLERIKTSLSTIKDQIGDSITLDIKFDEQSLLDFTDKSDGLVNNLNKIVEDLKEVQTTISGINPDVLKAVAKLPANKKGEIGVGATKETNAKDANKRRGAEASGDAGWSQAEYDDRTELIELETAKLHELIETEGGVVKSTTEFRDSLGNLIKTQVKGEQEIDGATVKTTYTTGYKRERKLDSGDVIPSEAFHSSISSDDYAKAEKAVTNALQEQEKAIQKIVELRAKMHFLDPESDKDNIALLRSQIKEQQGIVEKNDRIINQNKEVVTQEERIKNSLDAREKAVLKVAAAEETARKKAEKKASKASSKANESKVSKSDEVLNAYKELSVLIPKIQKLEQQRDSGKNYNDGDLQKYIHQQERYETIIKSATTLTDAQKDAQKQYLQVVEDSKIAQEAFNSQLEKTSKASGQLKEIGATSSWIKSTANKTDGLDLRKATDDFRAKVIAARQELAECVPLMEKLEKDEPITSEQLQRIKEAVVQVKQLDTDWKNNAKGTHEPNENSFSKLLAKAYDYQSKISGASSELRGELNALIQKIIQLGKTGSQADLSDLGAELANIQSKARSAGQEVQSFWDMVTSRARGMSASALAQYFSLYDIIRYTKEMAQTIREYDTALTKMRKVSDESVESLKRYQQASFDVANQVGTTSKQIQQSTADFLRLGESFEDAKESAKDATILLNVSEFSNINDATESLISMAQAYKDLDKMEIIDVLNKIGNEFPSSTNKLAEGLQNSAAVLSTQGVEFEKAVALLTAGDAINQNMNKTSRGIRTIALRVAGTEEAKEQLSELGEDVDDFVVQTQSKTDQIIRDYTAVASNAGKGISVLDQNGNLRDTFDIMLDISHVYKEIQEEDKKFGTNRASALVEVLAGKNMSNVAASILENEKMLEDVYTAAQNAEGSGQEELDKYLDSLDGRIAKFKNQMEDLETSLVSSNLLKFFVDFGTGAVKVLDDVVDKIGLLGTLATTGGIAAFIKSFNWL